MGCFEPMIYTNNASFIVFQKSAHNPKSLSRVIISGGYSNFTLAGKKFLDDNLIISTSCPHIRQLWSSPVSNGLITSVIVQIFEISNSGELFLKNTYPRKNLTLSTDSVPFKRRCLILIGDIASISGYSVFNRMITLVSLPVIQKRHPYPIDIAPPSAFSSE